MMTDIDDILDGVAEDVFSVMGVDATFTPAAGDPVSLKVVVEKGVELQPEAFGAQVTELGVTVEYLLADTGREADRNETFTVGDDTYTVQAALENDGRYAKAVVK